MADASKQVRPTGTVSQTDTGTTHATDTALSRNVGGTGVSVTTMAQLLTELGRGAANGLASLDGSTLVPAAQLPAMVGTDGATNGTKGAVPAPAGTGVATTSDTLRPLRGDGTWGSGTSGVSSVWLTEATDHNGVQVFRFEGATTPTARVFVYATDNGRYVRIGSHGSGATNLDFNIEPKGASRATEKGDPLSTMMRPTRMVVAKAFGTTFDTIGLATPTLTTPGAAASSQDDANSTYVTLTNDPLTQRMCGVSIATVTKRQLTPELIVVFRAPLLRSRLWIGLFESDPSSVTDLPSGSGGIAGVGVYYDSAMGQPQTSINLSDIAVNGTAKTYTRTTGSFIADGFRVGQTATWINLSNAGNNGARVISALTATVMTVTDGGGTMVNESAGASTTASASGTNSVFWRFVTAVTGTSASDIAVNGTANTYTRTSGSFITDGFAVGMFVNWTGFANGGNNLTSTEILTLTATVMTVADLGGTMVNEVAGASVVCVSPSLQTETVTGAIPTANTWTAFRIRSLTSTTWEFSTYNTLGYWDNAVEHTTTSPSGTQSLGLYCTNYQIRGATAAGPSITFAASGQTITRGSGSWYDDGFKVGDSVTVSGAVASAGANNVVASITALTATVMTISVTTPPAGAIINEGPITSAALTTASSSFSLSVAALRQE